jgi:sulfate transport system substrate-binding protein
MLLSAISLITGNAYAKEFLNVSYDPTREFYQEYNKSFGQYWKSKTGQEVEFKQSHGGSVSKHVQWQMVYKQMW